LSDVPGICASVCIDRTTYGSALRFVLTEQLTDSLFRHSFWINVLAIFINGFISVSVCFLHFFSNTFITFIIIVSLCSLRTRFSAVSALRQRETFTLHMWVGVYYSGAFQYANMLQNITKYMRVLKRDCKDYAFHCCMQNETLSHKSHFSLQKQTQHPSSTFQIRMLIACTTCFNVQ
jgi:hypothetical protein